jgi:hypothetical protein
MLWKESHTVVILDRMQRKSIFKGPWIFKRCEISLGE